MSEIQISLFEIVNHEKSFGDAQCWSVAHETNMAGKATAPRVQNPIAIQQNHLCVWVTLSSNSYST